MAAKQLGPKGISNQSYGLIQLGLNVAGMAEKLRQLSESRQRKVAQKGKKLFIRFDGTIRFPWGLRHDSFSRLTESRIALTGWPLTCQPPGKLIVSLGPEAGTKQRAVRCSGLVDGSMA